MLEENTLLVVSGIEALWEDATSSSTPKKPVLNRAKIKSSDQLSVSDFCRLCKCSFETIYGNFPSKNTSGELSEEQQPKTSYISTEIIFNVSCRREQEKAFSELYFGMASIYIIAK